MGCCASRDEDRSESRRVGKYDEKAASFTSMEEETVKEVMSETTARPACFVSRDIANQRRAVGVYDRGPMTKPVQHYASDEISEVGSLYENVTAMSEGRESNEYCRYSHSVTRDRTPVKCPKSKSFSGEVARQRSGRRSPVAKSTEPSPRRRRNVEGGSGNLRSVSRRDSPQKAGWGRPDTGEGSGRRSRSPGMRAENGSGGVGRSLSGRKMQGQSPRGTRGRRNEEGGGGEEGKWGQADESLENPLVALECFIFL